MILLYHIVCPAKYRKAIFTEEVDAKLKEICEEIALRYEIEFLEIGTDSDHVHFLVQSVPMYSPKKIVQIIKSITAQKIFEQMPEVKKQLWGGQFWSDGLFRLNSRRTCIRRRDKAICQKSRNVKGKHSTPAVSEQISGKC